MPILLVIDDEKEVCQCIEDVFKEEAPDFLILSADNGPDAIDLIKKHKPDVILLDLKLNAALEGIEVFQQIKVCHPKGKIIIFTGYAGDDVEERLRNMGADDFVDKPLTPPEVLALVKRLAAKKASEEQHG